jgi:hypothetical protein
MLAAGSRPAIPPIDGLASMPYLTSDTVMRLEKLPKPIVVPGGGYIAAQMSHIFGSLGTKVTIVARGEHLLSRHDADIRARFTEAYRERRPGRSGRAPRGRRRGPSGCRVARRRAAARARRAVVAADPAGLLRRATADCGPGRGRRAGLGRGRPGGRGAGGGHGPGHRLQAPQQGLPRARHGCPAAGGMTTSTRPGPRAPPRAAPAARCCSLLAQRRPLPLAILATGVAVLGHVLYRTFVPLPAAPFGWVVLAATGSVLAGAAVLLAPGRLARMRRTPLLAVTAAARTGSATTAN